MHGTADLATILNPPRGFQLQYGQARVIAWETATGHNTIEWAGGTIRDVPVLADINALTIQADDVVGMLGWTSPEGVSSWWVLGKIIQPGEGSTALVIHGSLGVAAGGNLVALYPSGSVGVHFGGLLVNGEYSATGLLVQADGTGEDIFIAKHNHDGTRQVRAYGVGSTMRFQTTEDAGIEILSDELLWLYGDDEVRIAGPNGPVNVFAPNGFFMSQISGAGNAELRMDTSTGQVTYTAISSTRRAKRDITDLDIDPAAVMQMRPRSWLPRPQIAQCPDWMHEQHGEGECRAGEVVESPEDDIRQVGFIAEELDEIGLGDFVQYDDEGLPAAISYDRLTAALIPVLQQQQAQIEALTARLDALEQREEMALWRHRGGSRRAWRRCGTRSGRCIRGRRCGRSATRRMSSPTTAPTPRAWCARSTSRATAG